jgi:Lon protease-like protein
MPKRPTTLAEVPKFVPVFPLSGALLLPFAQRPLNIFEPRYVEMVDAALAGNRLIGLIQPEDTSEESPRGRAALQKIGCLGRHHALGREWRWPLLRHSRRRRAVRACQRTATLTPYRQAQIDASRFVSDFDRAFGEEKVDRPRFLKMMKDYAEFGNFDLNWQEIEKTGTADLVNFCCMVSPYGAAEKQLLLEADSIEARAEALIALAEYEMAKGGDKPAPLN